MKMVMVLVGVAVALWGIVGDVNGAPPCDAEHVSSRGLPTMHADKFDYIQTKLDEQTEMEFIETPLVDVIDFLRIKHELEIQLDRRAFEEAAIGTDVPITAHLQNLSLRSSLKHLLRRLELTYVVGDEILLITLKSSSLVFGDLRVYPVCDLVSDDLEIGTEDYSNMCEIITSTVSPAEWAEFGGHGMIRMAPMAKSLLITTSGENHERIEGLLATLRIAHDMTDGTTSSD